MLLAFAQWVQATAFFTAVRESWYVYPVIMSTHLLGIAMFGGMVLLSNLRLMGWTMLSRSVTDVVDQLRVPKRIGLIVIVTCGILMFGSKAEEYYYNIFFRLKMVLLALMFIHGWVFRHSVYCNTAEIDRAPRIPSRAKLAAALSMILWASIACAGRGIGYIDAPLDKIHAKLLQGAQPVDVGRLEHAVQKGKPY
jgi:hypothetical protein